MRPLKEKGQGRKAGNQASYTHKSPAVVGAGLLCGRRCRLRCRLGWCTRRAFMARRASSWCRCTWVCAVLGVAGWALQVVVCCVSCFGRVCRNLQCACSVVPTCVPASLVLILMPIVPYAWCYIVCYIDRDAEGGEGKYQTANA